jgi:hypothetical protein
MNLNYVIVSSLIRWNTVFWVYVNLIKIGTGHPTAFNSWLSTPCSGGMGCAVHGHVCMQVSVCACVCVCTSGASTV